MGDIAELGPSGHATLPARKVVIVDHPRGQRDHSDQIGEKDSEKRC
jgi:hypothetical protein